MKAETGNLVKVHYTGTTEGKQFDSSQGKEPLLFKLGDGKVIKGFEEGVLGMEKGEKKTVVIPAAEAYGERDEKLVAQVPKEQLGTLPKDVTLQEGMQFELQDKLGNKVVATVAGIAEKDVTLDLNHPLAGKELTFELELVDILQPKD